MPNLRFSEPQRGRKVHVDNKRNYRWAVERRRKMHRSEKLAMLTYNLNFGKSCIR